MRETSDLYKALLSDPDHIKESRLIIAGTAYGESRIVSLSTSEPLFSEDAMSVGGAVAREIDFSAFLADDVPRRATVIPEVRLVLDDQTSEWLQKGVFYIDTRSKDPVSGVTTVHGFDAMLMGEQPWIPAKTDVFPMPMREAAVKLLAVMGVELDPRTTFKTGDAYMVDFPVTDQTIRQTLRWIAAAHGANWITNDLGQFRMVPLNALPGETGYLVTPQGNAITFGGTRIVVGTSIAGSDNPAGGKTFVGQRAGGVEHIPAMQPIRRILLVVDDENAYVSESDTDGLTLEVSCPYGSQEMADDLLAQLEGYAYQPMQAEDALIDPAAELGDGVNVNGVYTILAQKDTIFDMLCAADIAAPGKAELESEYTFTPGLVAEFNYKLAQTRSLISKTSKEIRLEVQGLDNKYTALAVTLSGVTVTDKTGTTLIRGSSVETKSLIVDAANISGTLTASQITLTGAIQWSDLSRGVQNDINDAYSLAEDAESLAAEALDTAESALLDAENASDTVEGWRFEGTTKIDGRMLQTDTVMASSLIGGEIALLTDKQQQAGGMEITGSSSSSWAIELYSNAALRLSAYGNAASIYLQAGNYAALEIGTVGSLGYTFSFNRPIMPSSAGFTYCGLAAYPWSGVYSETDVVVTSDKKKKKDIQYELDDMDGFFDGLKPGRYRLLNGTSGRYHYGMMANDVLEELEKHGISTTDFAGFVADVDADGNPTYGLRYGEFIALLIWQVQKLKNRVKELEVYR